MGPYPEALQRAWGVMRGEAATNYGIDEDEEDEEMWTRMGPQADPTPTMVRNLGAAERRKGRSKEDLSDRQEQQCVGYRLSEGAQRAHRETIPGCGTYLFRSAISMPNGTGGTTDTAKNRKKGEIEWGSLLRCLWRKPGQDDLTGRGLDVPS